MRNKSVIKQRIYVVLIAVCVIAEFLMACAYDHGLISFWVSACSIIGSTACVVVFFHLICLEQTRTARRPRR